MLQPHLILFVSLMVAKWTPTGAQFNEITPGDRRLRCYTCSTVNGSHIVAGAGVDPGVFLSTIPLGSLPVTHRCADPFDSGDAVRAGVVSSVCEDGLCVKINYTDKWTERVDVLRACLPRSRGVFKELCTAFSSNQALGSWCVCGYDGCNGATTFTVGLSFVISLVITLNQRILH